MKRRHVERTSARPVILITGFGPFPGIQDNATSTLVPILVEAARTRHRTYGFVGAVLPTVWEDAPRRLEELFEVHRPSACLHFGVARECHGFRLERRAANACRSTADAAGCLPPAPQLVADGPDYRDATFPADAILERLIAQGFPASCSEDAGGYLCNAVLYHSLRATAQRQRRCISGFVHIPPDLTGPPLTHEEALRGAGLIVDALVDSLRFGS